MEVDLQGLIEKIKADGVGEAKKEADKIIKEAKTESQKIIDQAKEEADNIKNKASKEVEAKQENAKQLINQASRDVVLRVREELKNMFGRMLQEKVSGSLTPEAVAEIIKSIVDKWVFDKKVNTELLVSKEDKAKIREGLFAQLKKEAQDKIEIKISESVHKGFRIGLKGEGIYYDFSDESITESLKEFLSPEIARIIDNKDE